ncbi:DUF4190 domain-containing protein [Bifidobacterium phasiani]|uniref:DUF4190 domain-containing protein n=1 Tax=Bifidobacterium phasiani TaxID=2834431 RepID=A0ABS6WCH8_9BIFI|nr:DUF4190 domain-containing protein [Bifidobacterium phasiani]MBW3083432.1 DUF4190 domain-containing protein [Bifidobacterium phasiani]
MTDSNPYPQQPDTAPAGGAPQYQQQPSAPQDQAAQTAPAYGYAAPDGAYDQQTAQAQQPAYQPPYQSQQTPYGAQQPHQPYQQQYGAPYVQQPAYYEPAPESRWNVMCIVGFILAFVIPPAGLILSIIALVQINKSHEKSRGLSIAGIVVGAVTTVLMVVSVVFFVWALGFFVDHADYWYDRSNDRGHGEYSYEDDQICFDDGTCIDPYDFDLDDDTSGIDGWVPDSWHTATGDVPVAIEFVD